MPFAPSLRVVVVDDDETLGGLVAAALEGLGFANVTQFTRPQDALAMISARPEAIDLVITDRDMPGLDGLEFARRVSAVSHSAQIVLMTANLEALTDATLNRCGISAVLSKPFPLARLEALARARALTSEASICTAGVRRAA